MSTNEELLERRKNAVPRGLASATGVFAARAENAEVWDVEGKRYIDFAGGIGVLNAGHRHPKVMAAVRQQIERYTHPCFQVTPYEPYVALAEKLNRLAPSQGLRTRRSSSRPVPRRSRTPSRSRAPPPSGRRSSPSWAASTAAP